MKSEAARAGAMQVARVSAGLPAYVGAAAHTTTCYARHACLK